MANNKLNHSARIALYSNKMNTNITEQRYINPFLKLSENDLINTSLMGEFIMQY